MNDIDRIVTNCDFLQSFLYAVVLWPALVIFIGQFLYFIICTRRNGPLVGEEIIRALTEFNRNILALSMAFNIHDILEIIRSGGFNDDSMLFAVINRTFYWLGLDVGVPENAPTLAFLLTIVPLLTVVVLSMLRRRWYGRGNREQIERTDQHGAGGGLDQAV